MWVTLIIKCRSSEYWRPLVSFRSNPIANCTSFSSPKFPFNVKIWDCPWWVLHPWSMRLGKCWSRYRCTRSIAIHSRIPIKRLKFLLRFLILYHSWVPVSRTHRAELNNRSKVLEGRDWSKSRLEIHAIPGRLYLRRCTFLRWNEWVTFSARFCTSLN